jgi:hypothetical protein
MEEEKRECVKCGNAHMAAEWHLRQVRDVVSKQTKAQYLCGEAYLGARPVDAARHAGRLSPSSSGGRNGGIGAGSISRGQELGELPGLLR